MDRGYASAGSYRKTFYLLEQYTINHSENQSKINLRTQPVIPPLSVYRRFQPLASIIPPLGGKGVFSFPYRLVSPPTEISLLPVIQTGK